MENTHIPVMLKEVIDYLDPKPGENFIDCTLGGGGYTFAIAKKVGEKGLVISVDLDESAIESARKIIKKNKNKNIILVHDNFKNLHKIVEASTPAGATALLSATSKEVSGFSGIVFDLGLSSNQLKDGYRGFSFQLDAPLDMRFARTRMAVNGKRPPRPGRIKIDANYKTAYIVNKWHEQELVRILKEYGEERYAKGIAGGIRKARTLTPIKTTGQLVDIIANSVPPAYRHNRALHFATRTFQALRIATNQELDNLREALPGAIDVLKSGGRIAVISYHSLEDRIVKKFFKLESRDCVCPPEIPVCGCSHKRKIKIITRKILRPGSGEIKANPRARSAKMRVAEKI